MALVSSAHDEQRRTAFGTVVDAARYDEVRPGYSDAAASWLTGDPAAPLEVLDLAAGTGKLTRVLARAGHDVVAVDPSEAMLATLTRSVAGTGLQDRITPHVGSAEDIPLADATVDAVTVGQAWHWMRPAAAVAEIARVLRPGGVFGLAWNARDLSVPWAARLEELAEGTGAADARGAQGAGDWWPRTAPPLDGPAARERRTFPAPQRLASVEDVVLLATTYSGIAVRSDRDDVLEAVRALAASAAEADGSVVVPQVCHCFRYTRP